MKKIGIITYYYNSINYGGLLQAYALIKVLKKYDMNVEQISYDFTFKEEKESRKMDIKSLVKIQVKKIIKSYLNRKLYKRYYNLKKFRDQIPHSKNIYNKKTIQGISEGYDIYITGSDQVWNMLWYQSAFFLDFVKKEKKIAYGVSLGTPNLSVSERSIIENNIRDYSAISVREQDSVKLLTDISKKDIKFVLDPTLLLSKNEWDILASPRLIIKDYVFCYFIGEGKKIRKLAKSFAKQNCLELVVLPHPAGFNFTDLGFGTEKIFDAKPNDFISLIKYAKYIFTDSFHACVFSLIYQKQFFVFPRKGKEEMSNRIYSLLNMAHCKNHFCDTKDKNTNSYLLNLPKIVYEDDSMLMELKKTSIEFLFNAILEI